MQQEFFLGQGIKSTDEEEAANYLLERDHPRIVRFLKEYGPGKLGAYFVPPMFFAPYPEIVNIQEYEQRTEGKGKLMSGLKGEAAEHSLFIELKDHFQESKDDALVIHSHTFLCSASEKDFIVINLSKGVVI